MVTCSSIRANRRRYRRGSLGQVGEQAHGPAGRSFIGRGGFYCDVKKTKPETEFKPKTTSTLRIEFY